MHDLVCDPSPTLVTWLWSPPTVLTHPPLSPVLFVINPSSCSGSWLSKLSPDTVMKLPCLTPNPFPEAWKKYIRASQDTILSQTLEVDLFWWPLPDADKNERLHLMVYMPSMVTRSSKYQLCSPSPSWLRGNSTWWTPRPIAHALNPQIARPNAYLILMQEKNF